MTHIYLIFVAYLFSCPFGYIIKRFFIYHSKITHEFGPSNEGQLARCLIDYTFLFVILHLLCCIYYEDDYYSAYII